MRGRSEANRLHNGPKNPSEEGQDDLVTNSQAERLIGLMSWSRSGSLQDKTTANGNVEAARRTVPRPAFIRLSERL